VRVNGNPGFRVTAVIAGLGLGNERSLAKRCWHRKSRVDGRRLSD